MKTLEFINRVKNKEIDIVEHTHKVLIELKKINKEYNYLNTISEDLALKQAKELSKNPKGKLAGLSVSVKDSICVKDVESTAGSKILKGYKPIYNATAVELAVKEGAIIIGKTAQDEFGFGGFATNIGIGFKTPLNPFDKERCTGGSSGGAAGLTQKSKFQHIALGESTGGSIVNPASFCGVYGLCPTYGLVSRYGIIDYGSSLDKIGPITKTIEDTALMLEVISSYDKQDSTSIKKPKENYTSYLKEDVKGMKIGILKEAFQEGLDKKIESKIRKSIEKLESLGIKTEEISLPISIKNSIQVYYLIATSEASTNLAKYCGMRYGFEEDLEGNYNQYFTKVRSNNFGKEVKRRIMLGTFSRMSGFRDAFYIKAAKIRTLMIEEYKKAFKNCDAILSPTVPILPPKFGDIDKLSLIENYMIDILTAPPNLAGLPHLNIPLENELPIGMLLTSDHLQEKNLIKIGKEFN